MLRQQALQQLCADLAVAHHVGEHEIVPNVHAVDIRSAHLAPILREFLHSGHLRFQESAGAAMPARIPTPSLYHNMYPLATKIQGSSDGRSLRQPTGDARRFYGDIILCKIRLKGQRATQRGVRPQRKGYRAPFLRLSIEAGIPIAQNSVRTGAISTTVRAISPS